MASSIRTAILFLGLAAFGLCVPVEVVDSKEQAAGQVPVQAVPVAQPQPQPQTPLPVQGQPQDQGQGTGVITQQKNPDGSTITITRFNGPLPSSYFQSVGGFAPGFGPYAPSPFFYGPWGYGHPGPVHVQQPQLQAPVVGISPVEASVPVKA